MCALGARTNQHPTEKSIDFIDVVVLRSWRSMQTVHNFSISLSVWNLSRNFYKLSKSSIFIGLSPCSLHPIRHCIWNYRRLYKIHRSSCRSPQIHEHEPSLVCELSSFFAFEHIVIEIISHSCITPLVIMRSKSSAACFFYCFIAFVLTWEWVDRHYHSCRISKSLRLFCNRKACERRLQCKLYRLLWIDVISSRPFVSNCCFVSFLFAIPFEVNRPASIYWERWIDSIELEYGFFLLKALDIPLSS